MFLTSFRFWFDKHCFLKNFRPSRPVSDSFRPFGIVLRVFIGVYNGSGFQLVSNALKKFG